MIKDQGINDDHLRPGIRLQVATHEGITP